MNCVLKVGGVYFSCIQSICGTYINKVDKTIHIIYYTDKNNKSRPGFTKRLDTGGLETSHYCLHGWLGQVQTKEHVRKALVPQIGGEAATVSPGTKLIEL